MSDLLYELIAITIIIILAAAFIAAVMDKEK
jgi:hypothetical protein